jgi:NAD(P)H-hydrate epimerase
MAHFPQRKKANFKGQFGKILVIGGSSSYSGAPSFAAMAALELGVDLCIVLVPKSISVVVRTYSPNLILREGSDSILTPNDIPLAKELIKWADSVLIGPGMGLDPQTGQFFQEIITYLSNLKKPTVVDADGLKHLGNLFKAKISLSDMFPIIMTPHMGELHALIDFEQLPAYDNFTDRGIQLCSFVKKFTGGVILLKGVYDFIADSTSYRVNLTGCPEMAVGGTGDVLAGIVVALLGLSLIPFHACCLGAYLNGLLGEYSRDQHGHRILATDLVSNIRLILKEKGL